MTATALPVDQAYQLLSSCLSTPATLLAVFGIPSTDPPHSFRRLPTPRSCTITSPLIYSHAGAGSRTMIMPDYGIGEGVVVDVGNVDDVLVWKGVYISSRINLVARWQARQQPSILPVHPVNNHVLISITDKHGHAPNHPCGSLPGSAFQSALPLTPKR